MKIKVGKVTTWIILGLMFVVFVYRLFGVHSAIMDSFTGIVDDASFFMTLVCVSFCIVSIKGEEKSYSLFGLCLVDFVLVNQIYSNKKLLSIVAWFKNLSEIEKALCVVAGIVGVVSAKIFFGKKKKDALNKSKDASDSYEKIFSKFNGRKDSVPARPSGEMGVKMKEGGMTESDHEMQYDSYEVIVQRVIDSVIISICFVVIVLAGVDYFIFEYMNLDINRPGFLESALGFPQNLYYAAVISLAIVAGVVVFKLFSNYRKKPEGKFTNFSLSAVLAVIFEIVLFFFGKRLGIINMRDTFMSAIADNWFAFIFVIIIVFLILQIGWCIFLHFIGVKLGMENNRVIKDLNRWIADTEKKIVELVYNIIKGCIDLFDFIPDFFETIGVLLLDKDDKK